MESGTGLIKKRERYRKLIPRFPDRTDFYMQKILELEQKISVSKVCRRCGRPLRDEKAMKLGYGKECAAKEEAEASESVNV